MKPVPALLLLGPTLLAQAPSPDPPLSRGWVRHTLKLGQITCSFDTPQYLSPDQVAPMSMEGLVNLAKQPLREPGEPITTGLTLCQGLFDVWSPVLGLPRGQYELSIFVGEWWPLPGGKADPEGFSAALQAEFRELLQSGRNPERIHVIQDFRAVRVDALEGLAWRLKQEGVETWHHFLPLGPRHFVDLQFRILPRPQADAKELDRLRAEADTVLRSVRFRRIPPRQGLIPKE